MDLKKIESRVKAQKKKLEKDQEADAGAASVRKSKKGLKRAQRLKRAIIKKKAMVAAKAAKKENAG